MTNRLLALLLGLSLALSLAACGKPAGENSSPASSAPPESSSASPAPSQPEPEDPVIDDAKVREMLKVYGLHETDGPEGSPRLEGDVMGLVYLGSNWDGPEDLDPVSYYCWYLSACGTEAFLPHPKGELYGSYLPQEIFEEAVQEYFRVSVRHLRSDPNLYHEDLQGYTPGTGGGVGERPTVTDYSYAMESGFLTIDFTIRFASSSGGTYRLLVFPRRDGGWEYMNCEYRPEELPEWGEPWAEAVETLLTPEQRDLLDKARAYFPYFDVEPADFRGETASRRQSGTVQRDGTTYSLYSGSVYRGWEDFRADMLTVFTPEYFQELNTKDFGLWPNWTEGPLYTDIDGKLAFVDGAQGGNLTYLPDLDRLEYGGEEDDRLYLCRWSYYCDREDLQAEHPTPVSVKGCPITLERTAEGWRVAKYALPW